jgi:hypothetical protein
MFAGAGFHYRVLSGGRHVELELLDEEGVISHLYLTFDRDDGRLIKLTGEERTRFLEDRSQNV